MKSNLSGEQHYYYHSGLIIASESAIDEWGQFEGPQHTEKHDISIHFSGEGLNDQVGDYRHEVPGVGCYVIRGDSEIVVIPESAADPAQLSLFLTASAWGALCYRRGLHVLHGSAVRVRGRVFAFSGHSGAGKSSIAAWLNRRGYKMIGDDICRLEIVGDRVVLYPSSRRLKLWDDALQALGKDSDGLSRVATKFDKFYLPTEGNSNVDPVVLDAIYLLEWGDLGLNRLTGGEAALRILRDTTYRSELLDPKRKNSFIQNSIQIASRVPIYQLSRTRDLTVIDDTIALLERHWSDEFS